MTRRRCLYIAALMMVVALAFVNCKGSGNGHVPQPADTLYTQQKAMDVYDYNPVRALQIVDSAVILGNMSQVWADCLRSRIYSWTLMGQTVDSLLQGPEGVRFDSARVIGERLLTHDSLKANIGMHQDVLEVLVYVARQQQDTARWLRCSQELVEVCHLQGEDAESEALRTEAEMGAVLCMMGRREPGVYVRLEDFGEIPSMAPAHELGALFFFVHVIAETSECLGIEPWFTPDFNTLQDFMTH